jgi:carbamoyltransferase
LVETLKEDYLEEDHCFAGGCFLNVCANTMIRPLFRNMHIPPFTNDSGIHFGAAAWASYRSQETIEVPENIALLGKSYDDFVPEEENCEYYEDFDELCDIVAHALDQNKIVGWFQGRSEHGPRALGSRSLLMSPKESANKDIMNTRVKHREYWRPFAGVMLEDYVEEYFEPGFPTPNMLYSQTSITKRIPAITHRDFSCRIQTVNDDQNPKLCQLLRKLDVPVLMNTSFNISGEPIIETPEDAIASFKKMDIDFLVIGNYLLTNGA